MDSCFSQRFTKVFEWCTKSGQRISEAGELDFQSFTSKLEATSSRLKEVEAKLGPYNPPKLPKELAKSGTVVTLVTRANYTYYGQFNSSTENEDGFGVALFIDGAKYEGYWSDGAREGKGRFICADGSYYEGIG
eukprot:TRINITY_DN4239_c0_g2_i7.p1 TRINITY_DN4239_c0_g2~~TRINITY_DN4239_c0_g2_i7.p1  ORF type:complete len:134 (+),score=19.86 TRINITY_DN4239_c0_g2_i7:37-438(+)